MNARDNKNISCPDHLKNFSLCFLVLLFSQVLPKIQNFIIRHRAKRDKRFFPLGFQENYIKLIPICSEGNRGIIFLGGGGGLTGELYPTKMVLNFN